MNNIEADGFCTSLFKYQRQRTEQIHLGDMTLGGDAPIRIQSMTTTDTNNTEASADQSARIAKAGGEIVRLTTQGEREALNIGRVREELRRRGVNVPLVADVHFNRKAAETAANYVEAVRINPGNYTGEAKRFNMYADNLTDDEWHNLIVEKLRPLVRICKAHGTAIRIGVNHGSLSDRIMAKYGDTPEGMVASCTEYLDAFEDLGFGEIAISIKSSNTRVMVETVRMLAATLRSRGKVYPLHLGVTEAGSDAEGRIKSAAGIGALLNDGLGDTVRVSLTEAPEAEIPVAKALVDYCTRLVNAKGVETVGTLHYSPYQYQRRATIANNMKIGGDNAPTVIVVTEGEAEAADSTLAATPAADALTQIANGEKNIGIRLSDITNPAIAEKIKEAKDVTLFGISESGNPMAELRALALELANKGISHPLVGCYTSGAEELSQFQLEMSADMGGLFIDGLLDGLCICAPAIEPNAAAESGLTLLQACRARFDRTEFISCPGCGRTLYDIQETVAKIKQELGHLGGLKIGIMGCIVNGIGEMADADYGYVGAGRGKISLYRGKEVVKRSIEQSEALEALKQIIKEDGRWTEKIK
ncbi:MAG: (E)-4-hydroxy-3-methylbut-2-enyl-diphosphate synthase [Marinilabiliaceae bacterium]